MHRYEISNPSDECWISAEDDRVAGVAVLLLGLGGFGLSREDGKEVLPIFLLGGHESWCEEQGIENLVAFMTANAEAIASVLETLFYGSVREAQMFDALQEARGLSAEEILAARKEHNERHRGSMNNIWSSAVEYSARLRALTTQQKEIGHG